MGYISALFAKKVIDITVAEAPVNSISEIDLYVTAGIDPNAPADPKQMIPDGAFFQLLERIALNYEAGRSIAIRVGSSMRCDDYGAFGLAFKSAVDLWGSFQRVERYGKVVTSIANFVVVPGNGASLMAVRPGKETRLGLKMTNELAVAAATAISREVSNENFAPNAVYFTHENPNDLSVANAHFRCPLHYGADRDGLEISEAHLRAGNKLGDVSISDFFDTHLEKELTEYIREKPLEAKVRNQIAQSLSEGVPKLSVISARLAMSERTLQRQLAEQDHVYQELVDSERRNLAERLLRQSEFSLAEIAFMTGYAEQSTFTRAFKRWHGQSPGSYRQDMN